MGFGTRTQGSAKVIYKGPDSKYFSLCKAHMPAVLFGSVFVQPFRNVLTFLVRGCRINRPQAIFACSLPKPALESDQSVRSDCGLILSLSLTKYLPDTFDVPKFHR